LLIPDIGPSRLRFKIVLANIDLSLTAMPDPDPYSGPRRMPLWQEITIVLVIKGIALYLIWLVFFSTPLDPALESGGVGGTLLRPAPQPAHPSSPQESGHAARHGPR
jgi:hypothetical protein